VKGCVAGGGSVQQGRRRRQADNSSVPTNPVCMSPCQNVSTHASMPEMNSTIMEDMCTFDCSATGGNTSMANMHAQTLTLAQSQASGDTSFAVTTNTIGTCDPNGEDACECLEGFSGDFCNLHNLGNSVAVVVVPTVVGSNSALGIREFTLASASVLNLIACLFIYSFAKL
jgi:hypothetical protein